MSKLYPTPSSCSLLPPHTATYPLPTTNTSSAPRFSWPPSFCLYLTRLPPPICIYRYRHPIPPYRIISYCQDPTLSHLNPSRYIFLVLLPGSWSRCILFFLLPLFNPPTDGSDECRVKAYFFYILKLRNKEFPVNSLHYNSGWFILCFNPVRPCFSLILQLNFHRHFICFAVTLVPLIVTSLCPPPPHV